MDGQTTETRVLVIEDDPDGRRSLADALEDGGWQVVTAETGQEGIARFADQAFDVVVSDLVLPDIDGLEVLRRVKESHPDVDVIMVTGLSQIDTAVQAMKLGAFDYISKPFEPDELKLVVQRALERRQLLVGHKLLPDGPRAARHPMHQPEGDHG